MKQVPYWYDDPVSWDALYITGHTAPGIVEDIQVARGYRVDKKEGGGVDGGVITFKGKKLPDVTIRLKLWTRNHLTKLGQLLFSIYEKKTNGEAFDMVHPVLAMNGIQALTVEDTKGPTKPVDGLVFFELHCNVHAPPPPLPKGDATKTPTAKGAGTAGFTVEDSILLDSLKAERAKLAAAGKSTSQIDERIYNLEQRQKAASMPRETQSFIGPPSAPPLPKP